MFLEFDDELYDDLDDFSEGAFIYNGELFLSFEASYEQTINLLDDIIYNHENCQIKKNALISQLQLMIKMIKDKYCH